VFVSFCDIKTRHSQSDRGIEMGVQNKNSFMKFANLLRDLTAVKWVADCCQKQC